MLLCQYHRCYLFFFFFSKLYIILVFRLIKLARTKLKHYNKCIVLLCILWVCYLCYISSVRSKLQMNGLDLIGHGEKYKLFFTAAVCLLVTFTSSHLGVRVYPCFETCLILVSTTSIDLQSIFLLCQISPLLQDWKWCLTWLHKYSWSSLVVDIPLTEGQRQRHAPYIHSPKVL